MTPFASPTGEPRPDMLLLLGVVVIALSALRPREKWRFRWMGRKAHRHNPPPNG